MKDQYLYLKNHKTFQPLTQYHEIIDELDENQRIYLIKLIDSDKTS